MPAIIKMILTSGSSFSEKGLKKLRNNSIKKQFYARKKIQGGQKTNFNNFNNCVNAGT